MIFTLILPPLEEERALPINPWIYPRSQRYNTHTFYSNSHSQGDWPNRYEQQLLSSIGMGTKCVKSVS